MANNEPALAAATGYDAVAATKVTVVGMVWLWYSFLLRWLAQLSEPWRG